MLETLLVLISSILAAVAAAAMSKTYIDKWIPVDGDDDPVSSWKLERIIPVSLLTTAAPISAFVLGADGYSKIAATVLIFCCSLMGLIDLQSKIIPRKIIYPTVALASAALVATNQFTEETYVPLICGAIFFALMFILVIASQGKMGFGDVRYAFPLGMLLGIGLSYLSGSPRDITVMAITAVMSSLIATTVFFVIHSIVTWIAESRHSEKNYRRTFVPYGPSMLLGAYTILFFSVGIL